MMRPVVVLCWKFYVYYRSKKNDSDIRFYFYLMGPKKLHYRRLMVLSLNIPGLKISEVKITINLISLKFLRFIIIFFTAFLNLESVGSNGKEILFQAGPNHAWLIEVKQSFLFKTHFKRITYISPEISLDVSKICAIPKWSSGWRGIISIWNYTVRHRLSNF